MNSPIYWHPTLYSAAMRLLYGRSYNERYAAIAGLVPEGADVFEACAGDARLYRRFLRKKGVKYVGCDINSAFVRHAQRRGVSMRKLDIRYDPLPLADVTILHAGLYQFMPNHVAIIDRLVASARRVLIIVEPVKNLADSTNRVVAWLARLGAKTTTGTHPSRFNDRSFDACIKARFAASTIYEQRIARGREKLFRIELGALAPT